MDLTIYPLLTGYIHADTGQYLTPGVNYGVPTELPAFAWYVEGTEKKILIDTGMCETERADKWHHPGSRQEEGQAIHDQLQKLGVNPDDIDIVILTHLHWDHCSNMKKFRNVTFFVHEKELEFALDPIPPYYRSYESPVLGLTPPFDGVEFQTLSGETKICDGVTVFPTPGHSPGHQSVAVETREGTCVVAGDAIFCYENLKGKPSAHQPFAPLGRYTDVVAMWRSFEEIARRATFVLPGHEIAMVGKERYP